MIKHRNCKAACKKKEGESFRYCNVIANDEKFQKKPSRIWKESRKNEEDFVPVDDFGQSTAGDSWLAEGGAYEEHHSPFLNLPDMLPNLGFLIKRKVKEVSEWMRFKKAFKIARYTCIQKNVLSYCFRAWCKWLLYACTCC